ncbi:mechanosensitive ion channel family protein [Rhodoligotrophos ferricapiens]|uniref:mechanosensitive ion channel family protein n=1 Tax=Rhodoligotrophos ferricapiens TaxID=3069264 RepID=UPI00315DA831
MMLLGLFFSALSCGPTLAQPASEPERPVQVEQLLRLLADPGVQAWIKAEAGRPAPDNGGSANAAGAPAAAHIHDPAVPESGRWAGDGRIIAAIDGRLAAARRHLAELATAIRTLPAELNALAGFLRQERAQISVPKLAAALALAVVLGGALQWLFGHATAGFTSIDPVQGPGIRLRILARRLALALGSCAALAGGLMIGMLLFQLPLVTRHLALSLLVLALALVATWRVTDALLAPSGAGAVPPRPLRAIPMSDAAARFWRARITLFVGWGILTWLIIRLLEMLPLPTGTRDLLTYLLGFGQLLLALEMIWGSRRLSEMEQQVDATASGTCWLLSLWAVLLWVIWVVGAISLFWLLLVAVVLPLALWLTRRSTAHLLEREAGAGQHASIMSASVERGLQACLILLAIGVLAWAWNIDLVAMTANETPHNRIVRGILNALLILLAADVLWHVSKTAIDLKLAAAASAAPEDNEAIARAARLRTLLPILRNILLATIVIVAGMMALASLGVEIGPLIAGAGVVGVAIGFGAQTLVKDIISGMFYLFDDAFRVGDYIQSGSHKGTVEGFSLRSIRLRHQRGPVYTVPFGELGAVENLSRDWVIDKSTLSVTYDTDLEQVRKIIKEIGQKLKADPEFAPHIIDTLKMQGVQEFGDYAIQIRMKLTTKPGEQFVIRRRAFAMIKKAFEEKGIKFARPVVHVASDEEASAAAAQQSLNMRRIEEADPA